MVQTSLLPDLSRWDALPLAPATGSMKSCHRSTVVSFLPSSRNARSLQNPPPAEGWDGELPSADFLSSVRGVLRSRLIADRSSSRASGAPTVVAWSGSGAGVASRSPPGPLSWAGSQNQSSGSSTPTSGSSMPMSGSLCAALCLM